MPFKDPEQKLKYNREYSENYRETHKEECNKYQQTWRKTRKDYHKKWLNELKLWVIEQLENKCSRCGLTFPLCCYDFHHTGEITWSTKRENASDYRTKELVKWRKTGKVPEDVKLLCSNCHRIIHHSS